MRKLLLFLPGLVLAAGAFLTADTSAQEPAPTAGTLLAGELPGIFGGAIGPDGALYMPQGGTGGDTVVETPDGPVNVGLTGRIARIDSTGAVTTAFDGIASVDFGDGAGSGVVDVVFIGASMYFMTAGGGEPFGLEDWPVGIYRANANGTATLIADLGAYALANPSETQEIPTGNPFGLATRGGAFLVTDGNANRLLNVTTTGVITTVSQFDNVVPTGVVSAASGPIYVTFYSPAPHTAGSSSLVTIDAATGAVTTVDTGTELIGVAFSDGQVYVVSMGDEPIDPEGPPAQPFTGTLYRLVGGQLVPVATGFMLPVSLTIGNNTAYIATLTGEVWRVQNLSLLQEITPTPTTVPTSTPASTETPVATETTAPATATATATTPATATAPATATPTAVAPGPPATGSGIESGGTNWFLVWAAVSAFALAGSSVAASGLRRKQ
ncbi:MAG: ScyD/ScyE family protein [Dehalococcoidia bacterium]